METSRYKNEIRDNGFTIIEDVFTETEIQKILNLISEIDTSKPTFRKSEDLFAIRQFLKEIPDSISSIFNAKIKNIITELFGENYFVTKSIYFDKPEQSNWFVAYHQDLTISVDKKIDLENFGPWTVKQNQFAVQPPIDILKSNFTIRIHLDETTEYNGALKVVPKSHNRIYRPETIDWENEKEIVCNVRKGGIMIMKPLLLHSSARTTDNKKRRVIHIEFGNQRLPENLNWSEYLNFEGNEN